MSDRPAPSESLAQNSHPASLAAPAPEYPTGPDLHSPHPELRPNEKAPQRTSGIWGLM